jgi:RNA polymerase sigma factor (sigma-70 family)
MPAALHAPRSSSDSLTPLSSPRRIVRFATTHWSVVLRAGKPESHEFHAAEALARLCRTYWFPLYAHVRRRGFAARDAEDLTQEFFARLLARASFAHANPQRGRFRTFILTALDNFLADEWAKIHALKRGGGQHIIALDVADAEVRLALETDPTLAPDQAFDREWALALLRSVLEQLEDEYRRAGKADLFTLLKPTLTGARESQPYAELASLLGRNENAVKAAVHRLRQRYRALLRAEVAHTLLSPAQAGTELRLLLEALGR